MATGYWGTGTYPHPFLAVSSWFPNQSFPLRNLWGSHPVCPIIWMGLFLMGVMYWVWCGVVDFQWYSASCTPLCGCGQGKKSLGHFCFSLPHCSLWGSPIYTGSVIDIIFSCCWELVWWISVHPTHCPSYIPFMSILHHTVLLPTLASPKCASVLGWVQVNSGATVFSCYCLSVRGVAVRFCASRAAFAPDYMAMHWHVL